MGGTRFMVIKFKELIKTIIFAILGVVLIIVLINFITVAIKGNQSDVSYKTGTYTSQIDLNNEVLNVIVTIEKNKIESITLSHSSETIPVFYPLFETTAQEIANTIVTKQSIEIELPEQAQVTSKLLIGAVSECLAEAKK